MASIRPIAVFSILVIALGAQNRLCIATFRTNRYIAIRLILSFLFIAIAAFVAIAAIQQAVEAHLWVLLV